MGNPIVTFAAFGIAVSLCGSTAYAQNVAWEKTKQTIITDVSGTNAVATFWLTNKSTQPLTVSRIKPSCTCTFVRAPRIPAQIPAGRSAMIRFDTDIKGKRGFVYKSAQVFTSAGMQKLEFNIAINAAASGKREQNQAIAKTDRQAVFRGKCAACHADPAKGKSGAELFASACGICHAAEHRASMVPDLRSHPLPNAAQLNALIRHGKPNSLMPAFHENEGGPLNNKQIDSLVGFLLGKFQK